MSEIGQKTKENVAKMAKQRSEIANVGDVIDVGPTSDVSEAETFFALTLGFFGAIGIILFIRFCVRCPTKLSVEEDANQKNLEQSPNLKNTPDPSLNSPFSSIIFLKGGSEPNLYGSKFSPISARFCMTSPESDQSRGTIDTPFTPKSITSQNESLFNNQLKSEDENKGEYHDYSNETTIKSIYAKTQYFIFTYPEVPTEIENNRICQNFHQNISPTYRLNAQYEPPLNVIPKYQLKSLAKNSADIQDVKKSKSSKINNSIAERRNYRTADTKIDMKTFDKSINHDLGTKSYKNTCHNTRNFVLDTKIDIETLNKAENSDNAFKTDIKSMDSRRHFDLENKSSIVETIENTKNVDMETEKNMDTFDSTKKVDLETKTNMETFAECRNYDSSTKIEMPFLENAKNFYLEKESNLGTSCSESSISSLFSDQDYSDSEYSIESYNTDIEKYLANAEEAENPRNFSREELFFNVVGMERNSPKNETRNFENNDIKNHQKNAKEHSNDIKQYFTDRDEYSNDINDTKKYSINTNEKSNTNKYSIDTNEYSCSRITISKDKNDVSYDKNKNSDDLNKYSAGEKNEYLCDTCDEMVSDELTSCASSDSSASSPRTFLHYEEKVK